MNFLPALPAGGHVAVDGAVWPLLSPLASGPVTLGLRPQELRLSTDSASGPEVKVEVIEELGSSRLVHARVGTRPLTLELFTPVPSGARLYLDPRHATAHYFGDDGRRLP